MPTVTFIATVLGGLALATISGYRLFLPLLGVCMASRADLLPLQPDFLWLQADLALILLTAGTVVEISLSYFPRLNPFRAILTLPACLAAGAILATCLLPVRLPWLRWSAGLILGGACAAITHISTSLPVHYALKVPWARRMATAENSLAAGATICSIFLPALTGIAALVFVLLKGRRLYKRLGFPAAR
jgi:hypothetical protein